MHGYSMGVRGWITRACGFRGKIASRMPDLALKRVLEQGAKKRISITMVAVEATAGVAQWQIWLLSLPKQSNAGAKGGFFANESSIPSRLMHLEKINLELEM